MEMAILAKDGIEVRSLLRARPVLIKPPEPVYEVEITGETEAQKKNIEVRNQGKEFWLGEPPNKSTRERSDL